jgi:AraC-like DNA-binding protein
MAAGRPCHRWRELNIDRSASSKVYQTMVNKPWGGKMTKNNQEMHESAKFMRARQSASSPKSFLNARPWPPSDDLSMLLDAIHVERSLWGIVQLGDGGGLWASRIFDIRFVFLLYGSLYLETSDRTIHLSKGDVVLLTKGSKYSLRYSRTNQTICADEASRIDRSNGPACVNVGTGEPRATVICATMAVDPVRWGPVSAFLPDIIHLKRGEAAAPNVTSLLSDPNAFKLLSIGPGADTLLCRIADICIIQSLRAYAREDQLDAGHATKLFSEPRVTAALRFLHANPELAWSVSELARQVGMSRAAFAAAFNLNVGEPPICYLTKLRMTSAAQLLRLGRLSVSKIADQVGYGSETAFSRTFKRHCGMAPRTYQTFHRSLRGQVCLPSLDHA